LAIIVSTLPLERVEIFRILRMSGWAIAPKVVCHWCKDAEKKWPKKS